MGKYSWRPVVYSADCDEDGDCPCGVDYADCGWCLGPTQDGVEYEERDGVLYGRPVRLKNTRGNAAPVTTAKGR